LKSYECNIDAIM